MKKSPFVLQALGILGLEEILNLSKILKAKTVFKKAAGQELISSDDADEPVPPSRPQPEAKILTFPAREILQPVTQETKPVDEKSPHLDSELVLYQRELARESDVSIARLDARKGYTRSTELYVVKTQTLEGKTKVRFASTNGVLVDKKQA